MNIERHSDEHGPTLLLLAGGAAIELQESLLITRSWLSTLLARLARAKETVEQLRKAALAEQQRKAAEERKKRDKK